MSIEPGDDEELEINSKEASTLVRYCLALMKDVYHIEKFPHLKISISSAVPIGSGLGSSAALSVATIGALHLFLKKGWNATKINELAYEVEKKQHTSPSGGDNTAVTFGGFLWYRKEFEFLKSMWQLPFRISPKLKPFVLVDSGRPVETTGEMVEHVKSKIQNPKSKVSIERIFSDQEKLTKQMVLALKDGDEQELVNVIQKGERNLERIGVVGKIAQTMIRSIEKSGGAAKITGAGGKKEGSGMLLCYHPQPMKLKELLNETKWESLSIILGEEGVRKEIENA